MFACAPPAHFRDRRFPSINGLLQTPCVKGNETGMPKTMPALVK